MFKAEHFEVDKIEDLENLLCTTFMRPHDKPIVQREFINQMSDQKIRQIFANCVNDGTLKFSHYTMHHLKKRLENENQN